MRASKEIVLTDGGMEKHFSVTQMSALKQERWINRALMLFVSANAKDLAKVKTIITSGNLDKIVALFGSVDYDKMEPLYDELLDCVEYIPEVSNRAFKQPLTKQNAESIIEEVKTIYRLRLESLKINFSFFANGETSPTEKATGGATITISKNTSR